MTKSLGLNELVKNGNRIAKLSSEGFWDNWLKIRLAARRPVKRIWKSSAHEHSIWEKAVHFEALWRKSKRIKSAVPFARVSNGV